MSAITQSQLDRFDWERGDVLSIAREDAARLAALPVEMFAPPFHAILRWFLGEDAEAVSKGLTDPRDKMLFDGLREHQRTNAQRRGDFLASQMEKSLIAKSQRDSAKVPRNTHGTSADVPRNTHGTSADVPSISVSVSRSQSVSEKASTTSGGVAQPSAAPPLATDGETITWKGKSHTPEQLLARLSPKSYFGHLDSTDEDKAYFASDFANATDEQIGRFLDRNLEGGYACEEIGVAEDASAQEVSEACDRLKALLRSTTTDEMRSFRREYGVAVLARVMWRIEVAHTKFCEKANDPPTVSQEARTITDVLKAVATALDIIRRRAK